MHSALQCLLMLAQWHRIRISPQQLEQDWLHSRQTVEALPHVARSHGMKVRLVTQAWERIHLAPLPAIAVLKSGECCVVGRYVAEPKEGRLLVQHCGRAAELVDVNTFKSISQSHFLYVRPRLSQAFSSMSSGLSWFMPPVLRNRALLCEILIVCIALQGLALLTPLFFQVVTDKVLVNHAHATLQVVVVGLVVAGIFETLFSGVRSAALARLSARIDIETGQRLMQHLLSLPMSYFASRRSGDTLARVREAENIRAFLTGAGINALLDVVFALLFMAVLLLYSSQLAGLVVLSLLAYVVVSMAVSPALLQRLEQRFTAAADSQAFLIESLNGIRTVKALAIHSVCLHHWNQLLAACAKSALRHAHLLLAAQGSVGFISRVVQVALLGFGAQAVMDNRMSVGELLAFNMLASHVSGPVLRLSQLWADVQQFRVSLSRVSDIFSVPPETQGSGMVIRKLAGDIRFERVTFRYRPDLPDVLNGVSLHAKPGDVVGIVGASGSGKSTIVQLLQGLYSPASGRIVVDGHDISTLDLFTLRSQMGVVLQESFLFNRSVRENIAISLPHASMEHVVAAARLAGAHEFIMQLPQGYETSAGEQGHALSGGQRQRIAIARALIKNPRILVFDEATSALDVESEYAIHQRMHQICANRTVIIIAHRLSAVRHATQILVMHQGRIVESGTRQILLSKPDGHFARMHQLQLKGVA